MQKLPQIMTLEQSILYSESLVIFKYVPQEVATLVNMKKSVVDTKVGYFIEGSCDKYR